MYVTRKLEETVIHCIISTPMITFKTNIDRTTKNQKLSNEERIETVIDVQNFQS